MAPVSEVHRSPAILTAKCDSVENIIPLRKHNPRGRPRDAPVMNQDPAHQRPAENALEVSIGRQVRKYRRQLSLSIAELCNMTGLSHGMVSKIENGNTSPSLNTLSALSRALNVPVTALFRAYEQQSDAVYVESGKGLKIERQGTTGRASIPVARPQRAQFGDS